MKRFVSLPAVETPVCSWMSQCKALPQQLLASDNSNGSFFKMHCAYSTAMTIG